MDLTTVKICPPAGPKPARIMIVGEAPGADEERLGEPFVGSSGRELRNWLSAVSIDFTQTYRTNVFKTRPTNNDIENYCVKKSELPKGYSLPPLRPGKYFPQDLADRALQSLRDEILAVQPNAILALGNTAIWALLGLTGISKHRGAVAREILSGTGVKVIPTYHPAAMLRQFDLRGIAAADVTKLERESKYPEVRKKVRTVYVPETLAELRELVRTVLVGPLLSFDIETKPTQITCIGYATSDLEAVVIPIYDPRRPERSYWSFQDELVVWKIIAQLQKSSTKKLTQNGLYDMQYLWRTVGIPTFGEVEDTMMIHHCLYPEIEKSLGFLGSVYTDEGSWKQMRPRGTKMEGKSDE